jgi:hypothetical protein
MANRSGPGRPGLHHRRAAWKCCSRAAAASRRDARPDRHQHEPDQRGAARPGPGRADGHAGGHLWRRGDSPDVLGYVTEPMAQLYQVMPMSFKDNVLTIAMCDPQKLSIVDELRQLPGLRDPSVVATERTSSRPWSATTPPAARASRRSLPTWSRTTSWRGRRRRWKRRRPARPERAPRPWPTAPRSASC